MHQVVHDSAGHLVKKRTSHENGTVGRWHTHTYCTGRRQCGQPRQTLITALVARCIKYAVYYIRCITCGMSSSSGFSHQGSSQWVSISIRSYFLYPPPSFNHCYVLYRHIHKPPFIPSRFHTFERGLMTVLCSVHYDISSKHDTSVALCGKVALYKTVIRPPFKSMELRPGH